jgi:hypothetical protein
MPERLTATCCAAIVFAPLALVLALTPGSALQADPISPTLDTDGDFLPDVVEWACLTNPFNADTDNDGVGDYVEVVQRANPRQVGIALPVDHEMRVVVTSSIGADGFSHTTLHLLFRFVGPLSLLSSFQPWLSLATVPGLQIPLDSLAAGMTSILDRVDPTEGYWIRAVVPLASENLLRMLLPCTIGARARIGTRLIDTSVPLFDEAGTTATLVPFRSDGYAVQSIGSPGAFQGRGSNRICVLRLAEVGSNPAGVAYEVVQADCDDCNGLQCGVNCPHSVGWVFVVPGGVDVIAGG